jgi:choline dehydrogenase-like flavoprotein
MAIKGLRLARDILRAPAMKRYVQSEILPGPRVSTEQELFEYACANAKTDHHPVGTCRMGRSDDPDSVVTPDLRVIGLDGLRVVDASVMPYLPSCNTNAPTIMVAEKAADMIIQPSTLRGTYEDQTADIGRNNPGIRDAAAGRPASAVHRADF